MLTGHPRKTVLFLAAAGLCAGCSQPSPFLARHTTIGTLKTSLSHLEYENQQLRTRVARLESDNRAVENSLVEEEALNGDLSRRLDDARNLLSQQGYEWGGGGSVAGSNPTAPRDESSGDATPSRTLPAGRSNRKPRKPPFTQIPGRVDEAPAPSADELSDDPQAPGPGPDPFGPQSWRDDDSRWLPIARGAEGGASKVR